MGHITIAFTLPFGVTRSAGLHENCRTFLPKHVAPRLLKKRAANLICNNSAPTPGPDGENQSEKPFPKDEDEAHEQHDIPQSSVDWNKLWIDFQASGGQSQAPSGREPTSKQEMARRKVAKGIRSVSNTLPTRQQLFADWRFWLAIILSLSFFTAFVQSTTTQSAINII